ncbi:MAG: PcfJ domain-containing protein [Oscillospiraceae bacterium]|nr:PcfJ domain-containing protein [Oscillospiraceae bacterium]
MKYAELIKKPFPQITEEQEKTVLDELFASAKHLYLPNYTFYSACEQDGVLEVDLYEAANRQRLKLKCRHFYSVNEDKYATWRAEGGSKGSGAIQHYIGWNPRPLSEEFEQVIFEYFKACPIVNKNAISLLTTAEQRILDERLEKKHRRKAEIIDARMSQITEDPPPEFFDWIHNWVFGKARYYFFTYDKKHDTRNGYCSHCRGEFSEKSARHNKVIVCPSCGTELTCKALGKTTQYNIRDHANVSYVQRITDGGAPALVERIYSVSQNIYNHHRGAALMKKNTAVYERIRVFLDPCMLTLQRDKTNIAKYYYGQFLSSNAIRWCSEDIGTMPSYGREWVYPHNLDEILRDSAVKFRNIEISVVAEHLPVDIETMCKMVEKMSALENLAKQGLYNLVGAAADTLGIRWSSSPIGKYIDRTESSAAKLLGVDRITAKRMAEINITADEFVLYKILGKHRPNISWETFLRFRALDAAECPENLKELLIRLRMSAERLAGYIEKQAALLKRGGAGIINTYRDYISMTKDLHMELTESVIFPQNIQKEHDALMKIKTDRKYRTQNKELAKRVKILEKLSWEDENFIIRPLRTAEEFLTESSVLSHCVKTYIDRCAKGETNIFVIRKKDSPDIPYYTVTLTNRGKLTQNLGKHNREATKEVRAFADKWIKNIVNKQLKEFIREAEPHRKTVKIGA